MMMMFSRVTLFAASFIVIFPFVDAVVSPIQRHVIGRSDQELCENPTQRREWRTLDDSEKHDYIKAVRCLQTLPARNLTIKEAKSRFDEFNAHHISVADEVHFVGQFLPWHRLFVQYYEDALRSECNYKGASPYWDWTQDSGTEEDFLNSPVWDPDTGFGGNGVPGTYTLPPGNYTDSRINQAEFLGCVKDGPFSDITLSIGPGKLVSDHCLVRGINTAAALKYLTPEMVANTTSQPTFELFRIELEGGSQTPDRRLHDSGHIAIGGEMSNFYSSPGEPLFYLHHANLDRIWWTWQTSDPSHLYAVSGRSSTKPPYSNVTLDFPLVMGTLGETVPIRDVMDIRTQQNCYTYV